MLTWRRKQVLVQNYLQWELELAVLHVLWFSLAKWRLAVGITPGWVPVEWRQSLTLDTHGAVGWHLSEADEKQVVVLLAWLWYWDTLTDLITLFAHLQSRGWIIALCKVLILSLTRILWTLSGTLWEVNFLLHSIHIFSLKTLQASRKIILDPISSSNCISNCSGQFLKSTTNLSPALEDPEEHDFWNLWI